jgi:hypothetical protein
MFRYSILQILVFFLLPNHLIYSQDTLITEWELIKSSPLPNGNAEAWSIGTDQIGNVLWGVNMDMPGFFEFMDALVYKLDEDTGFIWLDTAFTGVYAQQSYNLKVTDSLVYLGGRTCNAIGIDSCDALVLTTNVITGSTGWNFIWDAGYGYEEIDGIVIAADGIYVTGWSVGNGTGVDVLLMKLGFSGNIIWQTTWGGATARDDHQDGHIVVDDSLIYLSGLYNGSVGLGWEGRALLAKFDKSNGNFVDSTTYGRQDVWLNAENALGMTTDGAFLYTVGYTTTSANNWDIFVAKFDKNLNQMWYNTWGGSIEAESARAISIGLDGSIYIGGNTASYGSGGQDIILLKYDPSGNLLWYKTWGDTIDDQCLDIHIHDNYMYLTGKTNSFHPTQKWEAVLLKVNLDSIVSVEEQITKKDVLLFFSPNPTSNTTTLKFHNPKNNPHHLYLYDVVGRKILAIKNIRTNEIKIEKQNFTNGIFFYQLWSDNKKISTGKLIIE